MINASEMFNKPIMRWVLYSKLKRLSVEVIKMRFFDAQGDPTYPDNMEEKC